MERDISNSKGERPSRSLRPLDFSIMKLLICIIIVFHYPAESSHLKFEPESSSSSSKERILACYYGRGKIDDTLVPSDVCTHIIFAFAHVSPDGIVPNSPKDVASYRVLAKLKEKNRKLRFIISLNTGFPSVVSFGTGAMLKFSLSAMDFLKKYNFDGIDLDWEFPGVIQKKAYAEFLQILGIILHRNNKTLSLAMPNDYISFEHGYFVDTINNYADFVTIMTYDFHYYTPKTNQTDFNSPLYSPKGDRRVRSTSGTIGFYRALGVSPSKMLVGFPTYAYTYELANAAIHGVHAPVVGRGAPGPATHSKGYYMIQDVCVAQKRGGKVVIDAQAGAEYMYYGKTWAGFNGMYSAVLKTDWLKKNNLAGVGVWTFQFDDPHNVCGLGAFPVLRKIRSGL